VVGVLLWLVNRFIPIAGSIKSILNAVVVIAVVLCLLDVFGLFHSLSSIHVGRMTVVVHVSRIRGAATGRDIVDSFWQGRCVAIPKNRRGGVPFCSV
jgi:hypothetical protein